MEAFLEEINVTKFSQKIKAQPILEPFFRNQSLSIWLNERIEYKFGKVNLVWKNGEVEIFAAKYDKVEKVNNFLNKLKKQEIEYDIDLTPDIAKALKEELNCNFIVFIPPGNIVPAIAEEVIEDPAPVEQDNKIKKSIAVYTFSNLEKEESRKYLFQLSLILKKNYISIKSEYIGYIKLNNKKLFGKDKILTYNSAVKDKLTISHFCTKDINDIIEWVRDNEKELSIVKFNFPDHTIEEVAKFNEEARSKKETCYWVKEENKITCVFKNNQLEQVIDCILSVSSSAKKEIIPKLSYLYYILRFNRLPAELDFFNVVLTTSEDQIIKKSNIWISDSGISIYGSDEHIETALEQINKAMVAFESLSSTQAVEFLPSEIRKHDINLYVQQLSKKYGIHVHNSEAIDGRIKHLVIFEGLTIMLEKARQELDKMMNPLLA